MVLWPATTLSVVMTASLPPLYRIQAATHLDAGRQHGRLAADRIKGWLATEEMSGLLNFTLADGADAFSNLKRDNQAFSPALAEEVAGMAEGAGVPVDHIWVATLINELEALMPHAERTGHCSDLYAVADGGFSKGFAHGHNEDWPGPIKQFWYFVSINATTSTKGGGGELASCAGMVYPGGLVGWAATWNAHGMYLTQNSLFPARSRRKGLASAFVQRHAICGPHGGASSFDEVVSRLSTGGWAQAASVNIVDLAHGRMGNVEVYEDRVGTYKVSTNYSHFNAFKEIRNVEEDGHRDSSHHRQARVDALPAPRTADDIVHRLSDTTDTAYPIYRAMTLATLVLDGAERLLQVWCCGSSATSGPPIHSWDLGHFFS